MPNITHLYWVQVWAPNLANELRCRWPWLTVVCYADGISIDTDRSISGRIELRMPPQSRERDYLTAVVYVSGGEGLSGDLSEVEAGLQEYRAIVDALHFSARQLSRVKVWVRPLPCEGCNGTGRTPKRSSSTSKKSRAAASKCPQCDGTGHRKDPTT